MKTRIPLVLALLGALLGAAALAQEALFDALLQRPVGNGTLIVPDTWLRRWDPVTVFFATDKAKAGPEDRPERFAKLSLNHPGAWTWLDARTLQFRPADPWPPLTRVTLTAGETSAKLSTLLPPPTDVVPWDGQADLPPVDAVELTFPYAVPAAGLARMLTFEVRDLAGQAPAQILTQQDFTLKAHPRVRPNDPAQFTVRLRRPIPPGQRVTLNLGLADDPRAATDAVRRTTFTTAPPFRVRALGCQGLELPVSPEGTRHPADQPLRCLGTRQAMVRFTSQLPEISPVLARDLVRIEPRVENLRFVVSGEYLFVEGDFEPDVAYRLSVVPAPLVDASGRPLEMRGESVAWLNFGLLERSLRFVRPSGMVERLGPQRVPVEGGGHARADLRVYRIDPMNRGFWPFPNDVIELTEVAPPGPGETPAPWTRPEPIDPATLGRHIQAMGSPAFSGLIDLPLGHTSARFGLDLAPILAKIADKAAPGHYLVGLQALDAGTRGWMRLQVTDLALSTIEREDHIRFVVTSLATSRPVAGAEVRIEGPVTQGEKRVFSTIFTGRTDSEGALDWTAPGDTAAGQVGRISVQKADDVLVIEPNAHREVFRDDYWGYDYEPWLQWALQSLVGRKEVPSMRVHLFTERPVYRPEHEVHIKGWVREMHKGTLKPASGQGFLVILGPGGARWRQGVTLSEQGTFYHRFEDADRPTGIYTAHFEDSRGAVQGHVTFTLDAYRLPTFKVGLHGAEPVASDRPFKVNAIADYYAGGRVARRPVRWRVSQYPYTWQPEARPGFVYSVDARFARRGAAKFQASPALSREAETDLDGTATLTLDPGIEPSAWPRTYVIEATVTGADDQTVTAVKRVRALPAFALGLKSPRFLEKAGTIPVEIIAVDGEGKPVVGQALKVHLKHRQWHAHLQATDFSSGEARYVTDTVDAPVKSVDVSTTAEPLKLELPITRAGVYLIEVEGQDRLGRAQVVSVDLYAAGDEPVAWAPPEAGTFKATPDKGSHAPGETARLVLESPYQTGHALVVVEAPDRNRYFSVPVAAGQAVVSVPIERSFTPRVPVHVLLMRGRTDAPEPTGGATVDLGRPDRVATTVWLPVQPTDHQLGITLTHPTGALPGEQIPLGIKLTDPQGRPSAGEVTVWLVDQAVLDLGKEQALDSTSDFLWPRASVLAMHDTRNLPFGRLPYTENPGGGDGEDDTDPLGQATVRRDFRPVPFYEPALQVGPNGEAKLMIKLPDSLTRFAVRAKVVHNDRFGYAKGQLDVRLPVLAQPVLPRFVRPGDEVAAGLIGRVVEGEVGAGTGRIEAKGAEIVGDDRADMTFGADKLARADFRLRVGTPKAGEAAEITVTAGVRRTADGASDAAQIVLPVRPDRRPEVRSGLLTLGAAPTEVPGIEGEIRPGTLERHLLVAEQPAALRMAGALEGLAGSTEGSTGQRIARTRVFLAADVVRMLPGRDWDGLKKQALRSTLEWITQCVDSDGRVAPFPGTAGQVVLTAAAVRLLVEARAAGEAIPQRLWDRLTETLRQALRSDYAGFVQGAAWLERAAATEALAAAGRLDAAYLDELVRTAATLGPEATARATLAAHRGGLPIHPTLPELLGKSVTTQLRDGVAVYAGLAGFADARDPSIRPDETAALALVAQALQVADAKSATLPVLEAALLALSTAGGFGNAEADAEALFALKGAARAKTTTSVAFAGGGLELTAGEPLAQVGLVGPGPVQATATGPLQGAWWTRYTPAAPGAEAPAQARGFVVTRTWLRVAGDAAPVRELIDTPGKALSVKVGDVIEEHVQVVNPEDRTYVSVELPFAAGLEPMNPRLATAPPEAKPAGEATRAADFERIGDDRATWYFVKLPKGTYDLYLRTRVTLEGRYQQPGARVEGMYQPEIMGESAGARVEVGR